MRWLPSEAYFLLAGIARDLPQLTDMDPTAIAFHYFKKVSIK